MGSIMNNDPLLKEIASYLHNRGDFLHRYGYVNDYTLSIRNNIQDMIKCHGRVNNFQIWQELIQHSKYAILVVDMRSDYYKELLIFHKMLWEA